MYAKESALVTQQHWLGRCSGARGDAGMAQGNPGAGRATAADADSAVLAWGATIFSVLNRFPSHSARPEAQGMGGRGSCSREAPRQGCHTTGLATGAAPSLRIRWGGCSLRHSPQMRDPSTPAPPMTLGILRCQRLSRTSYSAHRECHTPRYPRRLLQPPAAQDLPAPSHRPTHLEARRAPCVPGAEEEEEDAQ